MQAPRKQDKDSQLDCLRGGGVFVRREGLPRGERHSIRVPEPNLPRGGAQPKRTDEHGSRLWAHELSEHGLLAAVHLQANPADGVVSADRPVQAGAPPGLRGAVLLHLHLPDVSVFVFSAYIYMNIFYGVIILNLEELDQQKQEQVEKSQAGSEEELEVELENIREGLQQSRSTTKKKKEMLAAVEIDELSVEHMVVGGEG